MDIWGNRLAKRPTTPGAKSEADRRDEIIEQVLDHAQASVLVLLGALIIGMVVATLCSILGLLPWLQIDARLGEARIPGFGPAVQVMFTLFCVSLCAFLPSAARVLKLEHAHRDFTLTTSDIERAYRAAHAEDRAGAFTLSDDFDAVRERLAFLKRHPDLAHLEPEILELSAQMSFLSRDLAEVYSADAVARARAFLTQRQAEAQSYAEKVALAVTTSEELKMWLEDVEQDERETQRMVARLDADLKELLPQLGYRLEGDGATVLPLLAKLDRRETLEH